MSAILEGVLEDKGLKRHSVIIFSQFWGVEECAGCPLYLILGYFKIILQDTDGLLPVRGMIRITQA